MASLPIKVSDSPFIGSGRPFLLTHLRNRHSCQVLFGGGLKKPARKKMNIEHRIHHKDLIPNSFQILLIFIRT